MRSLILALALIFTGCGFDVRTNDSKQKVEFDGAAYTYVIVRMEFIGEIRDLCTNLYLEEEFASEELYLQQVSECTFERMALLDIDLGQVGDFTDQYCGPDADLSGLTPQQQIDIVAACAAVGAE